MELYTAIVLITVALLGVTIVDIRSNRVIDHQLKRNSIVTCLLIGLAIFFEWAGIKANHMDVSWIFLHKLVKLAEFCIAPFLGVMASISYSHIKHPKPIVALLAAHIIFEIAALKYGWIIRIDSANQYHRGYLYVVYIAVFSASILYCFISIVREEIRHYAKPSPVLMATLLFIALGIGIQMLYSDLRVDYMCVAMGNYFLYNHRCKTILQLDGLTHLLSRRCYEKDIEKLGSPTMILNMDVNRFKQINDTYGHTVGDYYLKAIADVIRDTYGKYGSCYRCGGDEFCVLLTKSIDRTQELNRLFENRIQKKQQQDNRFPGVSIGFALYDSQKGHIQAAVEEADNMMYSMKKMHKMP